MNIYALRNSICIYSFNSHSEGCIIYYIINKVTNSIRLTNVDLYTELVCIGSLDESVTPEEFADYNLSQWDALNIVIRFELAREMENEIDDSDIGKAIDKIKNINS